MEWPVNGFFFKDPVSKNWYLYVGEYQQGYQLGKNNNKKNANCAIYTSSDRGKTWTFSGDLFPANKFAYDSVKIEAPDVMVVYADSKYHMIFDWVQNNTTWDNSDTTGIGYAVADRPEGPFVVSKKPVKINTQYKQKPLLNRYSRMYAPMIIKRKNDWVVAYMMDTKPARSWALAISTSLKPEGPYGESKIMMNVEKKSSYPPLQEYYPAFMYDGYVYFPATSVSINRNYQSVYRVKTEDITYPDKYEIFSEGSFWHSVNVDNEFSGIWGQTITGFVDDNDTLYVMFPSKTPNDFGTINLAKASWNNLNRDKGFSLSANDGNSFSYIRKIIDVEGIEMEFKLDGTMHLIWDFHSPIDILDGWGRFDLSQNDPEYKELVINKTDWKINVYHPLKSIFHIDSGKVTNWNSKGNRVRLKKENGKYALSLNEVIYWGGILEDNPGLVGVALNPHSYLFADQLVVDGHQRRGFVTYGYYEALLNAGNQDSDWVFEKSNLFFSGRGAVSKRDSAFAKWNFCGKGFELYSPKGSHYGTVNIYLDGLLLDKVLLKNTEEQKSSMIYKSNTLNKLPHAVYIESMDGLLPVDCIKVDI